MCYLITYFVSAHNNKISNVYLLIDWFHHNRVSIKRMYIYKQILFAFRRPKTSLFFFLLSLYHSFIKHQCAQVSDDGERERKRIQAHRLFRHSLQSVTTNTKEKWINHVRENRPSVIWTMCSVDEISLRSNERERKKETMVILVHISACLLNWNFEDYFWIT